MPVFVEDGSAPMWLPNRKTRWLLIRDNDPKYNSSIFKLRVAHTDKEWLDSIIAVCMPALCCICEH